MNRFGLMLWEQSRRCRPSIATEMADPEAFFAQAGETIVADVTRVRDELLGPLRSGETLEEYRLRSYQALSVAEELVLADHPLLQAMTGSDRDDVSEIADDDPDLVSYYRVLAEVNATIHAPI